ncbi:MAG: hypothetical protein AABW92_03235 [Nanoarchaeota archaeon]
MKEHKCCKEDKDNEEHECCGGKHEHKNGDKHEHKDEKHGCGCH